MRETLVVRRETHVPASPAAVFALLTDPEKILRWMGTEAQLEPQPGGLYLVNVTGARCARGSSREVVPVHRLAYSFGWDGSEVVPPGSSLVEIDLIEQPDGTLLRLTHTGLPRNSDSFTVRPVVMSFSSKSGAIVPTRTRICGAPEERTLSLPNVHQPKNIARPKATTTAPLTMALRREVLGLPSPAAVWAWG